jgi:MFS family permease
MLLKDSYKKAMPYVIIGLGSIFYLYELCIRVIPSAITNELLRDFGTNTATLGFMSSLFYYAYALMQIPAGLLGDRFGPRRMLFVAAIICACALILMSYTQTIVGIGVSRFLIGIACSFGYIGPLMLASRWFDNKSFAFITGIIQAIGCIGAILGTSPIAYFAQTHSWREIMLYIGLSCFIIAILFLLIIVDTPKNSKKEKSNKAIITEINKLKIVLSNKQTWVTGLIGCLFWAPMAMFAELWGIPFLMKLNHSNSKIASSYILVIWIGVAIGSPLFGWISGYIRSRKKPIITAMSINFISCLGIALWHPLSFIEMNTILFFLGLSSAAMSVTFGLVNDNNKPEVVGTAIGFNNMAVILGATILQPIGGYIINLFWDGKFSIGIPIYKLDGYLYAFSILPILSICGILVCALFLKETNCIKQYK